MTTIKKREKLIHTIEEFEKIYLPEKIKTKKLTQEDTNEFAIDLANQALKKIKIKPF